MRKFLLWRDGLFGFPRYFWVITSVMLFFFVFLLFMGITAPNYRGEPLYLWDWYKEKITIYGDTINQPGDWGENPTPETIMPIWEQYLLDTGE